MEQEQEQAWDGLDETAGAPLQSRAESAERQREPAHCARQLLLRPSGGVCVFHVRVCNNGGFTIPSVQLRARQQLPGPSSLSDEPPAPRLPLSQKTRHHLPR